MLGRWRYAAASYLYPVSVPAFSNVPQRRQRRLGRNPEKS